MRSCHRGTEGHGFILPCILAVLTSLARPALFAQPAPAGGTQCRIAVGDFNVLSANPAYQFLGKGFAELISVELAKAKGIALIDRDRRNELLKEQEFSLSDAASAARQIEIGRLLSADFLGTGTIIEIKEKLTLAMRLTDVETGVIVFQDDVTGDLGAYDYISATIAKNILSYLRARIPEAVAVKTEAPVIKPAEVAVRFSNAVNAYDHSEVESAKKELQVAEKLDPESTAVKVYLDKLTVNTSKFKTMTEQYFPVQNPAYLGIIETDQLYLSAALENFPEKEEKNPSLNELDIIETDAHFFIGYDFPVGSSWGFGVQAFGYHYKNLIKKGAQKAGVNPDAFGAILSAGCEIYPGFSVGGALSLYKQYRQSAQSVTEPHSSGSYGDQSWYFCTAPSLGIALRNGDSSLVFDAFFGWSTEKKVLLDTETFKGLEDAYAPIYIENTLTLALDRRRTFFVLKQTDDIGIDRVYFVGRLIPAIERWLGDWFSVRAGIEGTLTYLEKVAGLGIGATGGLTIRLKPMNMDLDVNVSYRTRPSRTIPGETIDDLIWFATLHKANFLFRR